MVEPLDQIRDRCQKPRYKQVGNWMVRHILRDAALPLTWLLLHTPVTANQVTTAAFVSGVLGCVLMALPSAGAFLAGALLLQLWYYLDHVDGQIARYRQTACLTGRFYDFVMHQAVHGLILFALGLHVFHLTGQIFFVIWGFAGSFCSMMFNYYYDAQYKTFFEKLMTVKTVGISKPPEPGPSAKSGAVRKSPAKKLFSFLHKSHEIHVMMNILTLAALLQLLPLARGFAWRPALFLFYGLAAPLLAAVKLIYILRHRTIDADFNARFKILE